MVRVITQETYDEVVKENMDEFELEPEDAIKEAIAQFEAQGVDLSNIIKDLALSSDAEEHLIATTVSQLRNLVGSPERDYELVAKKLDIIKAECEKGLAHRVRAGKEGAYDALIQCLDDAQHQKNRGNGDNASNLVVTVLETLSALMDVQPDLLEPLGIKIMKRLLDEETDKAVTISTLKWVSTCCLQHEKNRQAIFATNIVANLKKLLIQQNDPKLLSEVLQVTRRLVLDDDIRMEFGKAHDHARELATYTLTPLTELMKEHTEPPLVSELMLTTATLLVRHEFCQVVASAGGATLLFHVLTNNYENLTVCAQAFKLVTALAGNDDVKRLLVKTGMVPVVVSVMNRHMGNVNAAALGLKCISALCLREPSHGQEFLENGGPELVVEAMKVHPNDSSVQKNACWAIRNMVARCREQNAKFHELGVESMLNQANERFGKDFGFDIKSALRDLDCTVKFDEQWKGKGVQMQN